MLSPRWIKVVRDLWENKSRTILVVLSVAVGVIAFGGMFATRTNLLDNLTLQFDASNALDVSMQVPMLDDDILRWIRRQEGVMEAQALTVYQEELIIEGEVHDVLLNGVRDFNEISINRVEMESGAAQLDRDTIFLERRDWNLAIQWWFNSQTDASTRLQLQAHYMTSIHSPARLVALCRVMSPTARCIASD